MLNDDFYLTNSPIYVSIPKKEGDYMENISFSEHELKKLPLLPLSNQIVNTEAKLYIYKNKDHWQVNHSLLKIFYDNREVYIEKKVDVIQKLIQYRDDLQSIPLVLPTGTAAVKDQIAGYIMPYIENNVNLSLYLNNPNVSLYVKLQYLKQVYQILENIEKVKSLENNFYLGDIHEGNFILDIADQKIKAVDMDSSYILKSAISPSKPLTFNQNLWNYPNKYPLDIDTDYHIPNHNTTILSFIYMLLNTLSNDKSYNWTIDKYYEYLNQLEKKGISHELLDSLYKVYDESPRLEFNKSLLSHIDTQKDYSFKRTLFKKW